eukprot:CAMPEP_0170529200 /NCGR_PEP_ID=MMETSP0209-20121228/17920_1 /TAXON_ID=665100 ORGANISM="Litonotus pictus, Strain P1" /NCGR_SAMPLE_ID=MMETSP0209 /ASSEMBLY_ACC=CAM_ASM_000301 /LENGTH=91 /DNA_ID=CAMNT_0010820871 /DNA_START=8 /DNA_END=279 /DNA_ORIENTATION=+
MKIKAEFSGGLELIFKSKEVSVEVEENGSFAVKDLVKKLKELILERPEFFLTTTDEIRPGILVLVNDADWEIHDKENTILENNDTVSFIST